MEPGWHDRYDKYKNEPEYDRLLTAAAARHQEIANKIIYATDAEQLGALLIAHLDIKESIEDEFARYFRGKMLPGDLEAAGHVAELTAWARAMREAFMTLESDPNRSGDPKIIDEGLANFLRFQNMLTAQELLQQERASPTLNNFVERLTQRPNNKGQARE